MFSRLFRFLRELLSEWAYGLTLPFRVFGPRMFRSEITRDARAAVLGGGDVARAAGVTLWAGGVFLARLPWLIASVPRRVWWFLRTRPPAYLMLGAAAVTVLVAVLLVPSWNLYREWQAERLRTAVYRQLDQHI